MPLTRFTVLAGAAVVLLLGGWGLMLGAYERAGGTQRPKPYLAAPNGWDCVRGDERACHRVEVPKMRGYYRATWAGLGLFAAGGLAAGAAAAVAGRGRRRAGAGAILAGGALLAVQFGGELALDHAFGGFELFGDTRIELSDAIDQAGGVALALAIALGLGTVLAFATSRRPRVY
jgi:hypothetical protein